MPKLWSDTVEEHRRAVRDAAIDATARLVAEHGLASVTMSKIAVEAGVGRATLYKYFPDLESVLLAWHQRQVGSHLAHLAQVRDQTTDPGRRLRAVLEAYALTSRGQSHAADLSALLHRGEHVDRAHRELAGLIEGLLADAMAAGLVRDDVAARELAAYCLHALGAAGAMSSKAAVLRLVTVVMAGLDPTR